MLCKTCITFILFSLLKFSSFLLLNNIYYRKILYHKNKKRKQSYFYIESKIFRELTI